MLKSALLEEELAMLEGRLLEVLSGVLSFCYGSTGEMVTAASAPLLQSSAKEPGMDKPDCLWLFDHRQSSHAGPCST